MLGSLGVEIPLGVMGLSADITPKANQPRPECTQVTGLAGILCPWILLIAIIPGGVRADDMSSSPLIL